jgi:hypothetical protein
MLDMQEGKTVLHVAAERSQDAGMMEYLVKCGVDINAVDEVRMTLFAGQRNNL